MIEPVWIPREMVLAMHLRQLAEHGGGEGVRDDELLDSALQRPENKLNHGLPDLADLAASFAYSIARNHPFIDGNNRAALVTSFTFLFVNGFKVTTSQEQNARKFLELAEGTVTEDNLADWFRENMTAR